ncbi:hypothetical protein [Streptomyces sp. NPDC005953]|uniref:hypothetical protein n=1 Tax=Streptomyces sp. NPDC005953 TaxID=3156719 RepID=UPI0033E462FC
MFELLQCTGAESMGPRDAGLELGRAHERLVQRSLQGVHPGGQTSQDAGVRVDDPIQLGRVDVEHGLDVERQDQARTLADDGRDGTEEALGILGLGQVREDLLGGLPHGALELVRDIAVQVDGGFRVLAQDGGDLVGRVQVT